MTFVFLSGCAYGDSGGGQQPAQIARQLVRLGHQVYHYQPVESRIQFCDGVIEIPCPRHLRDDYWTAGAKGASAHWHDLLAGLGSGDDRWLVVCCALPWYARAAEVAQELGWKVCYAIIDDWERLYAIEGATFYRREDERRLINAADRLVVTSDALTEKAGTRPVTVIPNGYDAEDFPLLRREPKDDVSNLHVIYWGYMRGDWFDWDLVVGLAMCRPQWAFHLIGPTPPSPQSPPLLQNVAYHGTIPVHWLSRLSSIGDVGIIPFRPSQMIDAVDPIKAYEYLACGLPIVSCRMPQLGGWPGVAQVPNLPVLWAEAIEAAAKRGIDPDAQAAHLQGRSRRDRTEALLTAIGDAQPARARKKRGKQGEKNDG